MAAELERRGSSGGSRSLTLATTLTLERIERQLGRGQVRDPVGDRDAAGVLDRRRAARVTDTQYIHRMADDDDRRRLHPVGLVRRIRDARVYHKPRVASGACRSRLGVELHLACDVRGAAVPRPPVPGRTRARTQVAVLGPRNDRMRDRRRCQLGTGSGSDRRRPDPRAEPARRRSPVLPRARHPAAATWIGLFIAQILGIAAVVVRYRRSAGEERQQIRWLAYVAVMIAALVVLAVAAAIVRALVGASFGESVLSDLVFYLGFGLVGVGVPAAMGIAILKYRLYDLDLVDQEDGGVRDPRRPPDGRGRDPSGDPGHADRPADRRTGTDSAQSARPSGRSSSRCIGSLPASPTAWSTADAPSRTRC